MFGSPPTPNASGVELRDISTAVVGQRHEEGILAVYRSAHRDRLGEPRMRPENFWSRLAHEHVHHDGFAMVTAHHDGRMVGFAYGSPRDCDDEVWLEFASVLPADQVAIRPTKIFVLREIAVARDCQGIGIGRALHDGLLRDRPESLGRLLVHYANANAKTAYRSWGWRTARLMRPYPDTAPHEVMVRCLPSTSDSSRGNPSSL